MKTRTRRQRRSRGADLLPGESLKKRYHKYLRNSRHWKTIRSRVRARDENGCLACGCIWGLNVHHLTYERVGKEQMEDLVTLCSPCHLNEHLYWKQHRRQERLQYWRFILKEGPEMRLAWGGVVGGIYTSYDDGKF